MSDFSNEPVFDALYEGVAPGGLRSKSDILLLILYMLKTMKEPISKNMIGEVMQSQGIANYFEVMGAISELIDNGNLIYHEEDGEELLILTEQGEAAVTVVEDDIPKTIRETAVKTTWKFKTLEKNARENEVKIEKVEDGYTITFSLSSGSSSLMELNMYVPDREQAEILKNNYIEDPVKLYSTILAALMVD
ncbi:MAG: DUF4364 family protein [Clostridia bacterium]|nr:DUF4364 family protein [Clostridia bacterium]